MPSVPGDPEPLAGRWGSVVPGCSVGTYKERASPALASVPGQVWLFTLCHPSSPGPSGSPPCPPCPPCPLTSPSAPPPCKLQLFSTCCIGQVLWQPVAETRVLDTVEDHKVTSERCLWGREGCTSFSETQTTHILHTDGLSAQNRAGTQHSRDQLAPLIPSQLTMP